MSSKKKNTHGGARKNSGRPCLPKSQKQVQVTVTLPPDVMNTIDSEAGAARMTRSEWLKIFLIKYL